MTPGGYEVDVGRERMTPGGYEVDIGREGENDTRWIRGGRREGGRE